MYFWELSQQILRDMWHHKLRSLLAMFGITWGTVAVVLLLAIGEGFYTNSRQNMLSIAEGTLSIYPGTTSMPYHGLAAGRPIQLKSQDVVAVQQAFPQLHAIAPELTQRATLSRGAQQVQIMLTGTTPDDAILTNKVAAMAQGRFLNLPDVQRQRAVMVLSSAVKEKLFGGKEAVGQQVRLNNVVFTVIGVGKPPVGGESWYGRTAIIPYTTAIGLWGDQPISSLLVLPSSTDQTDSLQHSLTNYFSYRFQFDPADSNALQVYNPSTALKFFIWFFRSIELFLGFCGVLTLGVGGVGIANVMYLIVSERTAEIGLRLALGARTHHILLQFLLEAGFIVLLGGLCGFLLATVGILTLHHLPLPNWLGTPVFSFSLLLATIAVLTVVGLLAGYFPAKRAARMQPIEALAF